MILTVYFCVDCRVVKVGNDVTFVCRVRSRYRSELEILQSYAGHTSVLAYAPGGALTSDCPDYNFKCTVNTDGDSLTALTQRMLGAYVCTDLAIRAGGSALLGIIGRHQCDCLAPLYWRTTQHAASVCQLNSAVILVQCEQRFLAEICWLHLHSDPEHDYAYGTLYDQFYMIDDVFCSFLQYYFRFRLIKFEIKEIPGTYLFVQNKNKTSVSDGVFTWNASTEYLLEAEAILIICNKIR